MPISTANRLLFVFALALLPLVAGCDFLGHFFGDNDTEPTVSLYADGLAAPVGIEVDPLGRLWVAEQGTGQNDSRISIVTHGGKVHPFLTGLPSEMVAGDIIGAWRAYFSPHGHLLIIQGEGSSDLSMSLLAVDVRGFKPGDAPLDVSHVEVVADIGAFVFEQGFAQSNPYAMAFGPGGHQYIVDAAANAIIRRNVRTGRLSVFAVFEDLPNPTPVGPPTIDAVPTDIVYAHGRFFVSALTGFPFLEGAAKIYEVDLQGNVSVHKDGLTTLVNLAVDLRDRNLIALRFAEFNLQGGGFQPETGRLVKVGRGGDTETIVGGLNFPTGVHPRKPGELFVSSIADGEILRITFPR